MSAGVLVCDATMWYVIYCFYHSLHLMNKLREIATVAIPCPAPGTVSNDVQKNLIVIDITNGIRIFIYES